MEIGTEEIPSGYFNHILDLLSCREKSGIKALFEAQNITLHKVFSYSTPRRLVLHIKDIPVAQDISVLGPPSRIAYDEQKKPTKALLAFLKKNKASLKDLVANDNAQEPRILLNRKDVSNAQVLSDILPDLIRLIDSPKTMRWDASGSAFARPIRWILALFGDKVINFEFAGLHSGTFRYGHRCLGY